MSSRSVIPSSFFLRCSVGVAQSRQPIFEAKAVFAANAAPFTTQTVCSDHTLPQGARLFALTSHTHKRGKLFRFGGAIQHGHQGPANEFHHVMVGGQLGIFIKDFALSSIYSYLLNVSFALMGDRFRSFLSYQYDNVVLNWRCRTDGNDNWTDSQRRYNSLFGPDPTQT
jgi:hypothetical protein